VKQECMIKVQELIKSKYTVPLFSLRLPNINTVSNIHKHMSAFSQAGFNDNWG